MSDRAPSLAERKRLVLARADLGRLQIRQAGHEARAMLAPFARRRQTARGRPATSSLLAAAVPLVGVGRFGRLLRIASIGLAVLRVARHLRR